jgi:hypothetical protein
MTFKTDSRGLLAPLARDVAGQASSERKGLAFVKVCTPGT